MAKKQEKISLIDALKDYKEQKEIDRSTLISVIEESFRNAIAKMYGSDENFDVVVNDSTGDVEISRNRIVVADDELTDENGEISLTEAQRLDNSYEIGEEVSEDMPRESFQRRAILYIKQALNNKISELERDNTYSKYSEKIGTLVNAEVYQIWKREIILHDDENNDLILPKSEQINSDRYNKGDNLRAVIDRVETKGNSVQIILSRTSPLFLEKLLEQEVPEISDGLITIHKVVRMPGLRAKVAVESYDERIDPVGACVGVKGSRVKGIVKELRDENIDVVNYTQNTALYIQRALGPIQMSNLQINETDKKAEVLIPQESISAAIGKGGINIKLASMLTGYTIDIFRDDIEAIDEEDVLLEEFRDEIDEWVIEAIKETGIDTAKGVLKTPKQELVERTDLEESTIDDVYATLSAEFEDVAE